MAFTTMALIGLAAYSASKTIQAKKQATALKEQQAQLDAAQNANPAPAAPGPTTPPAPPPSTTTTASNDVGAARMAADRVKKRASAGATLASPGGINYKGPAWRDTGGKLPKSVLNANHLRKILESNDRDALWAVGLGEERFRPLGY